MKTTKSRLIRLGLLTTVLLLLLTGCARSFDKPLSATTPVTEAVVSGTMQYLLRFEQGPLYNFTMTLPDEWVGQLATRNNGNVLYFDYIGENGQPAPFFSIEALSEEQLWKQEGGYPAYRSSILNTAETYFVYHLPVDAYYSGLPEENFATLAEAVPGLMASFAVTRVQ